MPNYLALEWGRAGICGLDAEVTGAGVQVRASFSHKWPSELGSAELGPTELEASTSPEGIGLWLKSQLRELDAGDRRLIVLVSREDVAMRLLELPEANDEMLPEVVRYQMGARSSVPLDQVAFDYLPLESAPPTGGRWVQSASVPKHLLQRIKRCAEVAELDLRVVGVATVARGEAIASAESLRESPVDQKRLVVCVVGQQLEVALWRGTDLLFSHVARAAESSAVMAQVQRALLSHEAVAGNDAIARVWLIAPPESEAELHRLLTDRLGCEVVGFEPGRDVPTTGLAAGAAPYVASLGALLASVESTVPAIDFLHPRRRVAKPDRTKMIAAVAIAVLFLLAATAYLGSRVYLSSLTERIVEKEEAIRRQDKIWEQGEPTRETITLLSSWESRRVNWLEQMQRIGAEMPGTDRVYLDSWRFDLATGEALGTTAATGVARQRQDAERLTQQLAERAGFRVRPNAIGSGGSDPAYPILLQLDAEVVSQSPRPVRNESE